MDDRFHDKILAWCFGRGYNKVHIVNDGEGKWKFEIERPIQPSVYNDWNNKKYEGFNVELISKNDFKQRIKDILNENVINGEHHDYNNDCLDMRFKNVNKLSPTKLFKKVWNNERYNFFNDGFINLKDKILIINFDYSMFQTQI